MKKVYQLLCLAGLALLFCGGLADDVKAETGDQTFELTEEERYDPKYFLPLNVQTENRRARSQDDTLSELEADIVRGLKNFDSQIDVSKYNMTFAEIQVYYFQIINNNVDLFYVGRRVGASVSGGKAAKLKPEYTMDADEAQNLQGNIDEAAAKALSALTDDMEEYEKALAVHDWLATYCEYDYESYLANNVPEASHSLYGVLVNRTGVCDSYAKAYRYLMTNKLGIPCYIVSSDTINHAWNIIQIGGNYYHVDVTWDDPAWDSIGRVMHGNFLLSDNGITQTGHNGWDSSLTASDTSFEHALWAKSQSSVIYQDGYWYYTEYDSNEKAGKLYKTEDLISGSPKALYSFDRWMAGASSYWQSAYAFLWKHGESLIFNGPKKIYQMPFATEQVTELYNPTEIPSDSDQKAYGIYGFQLEDDWMHYAVSSTPNLQESQKKYIHSSRLPFAELKGFLSMEGELRCGNTLSVTVNLEDGQDGALSYSWRRNGEPILGANTQTYVLTGQDIGANIIVKVTCEGYVGELVYVTDEIRKALPKQPDDRVTLDGELYGHLSDLDLPAGYRWKNPDTQTSHLGAGQSYPAVYCPDENLYDELEVTVYVTVSCTKHANQETRNEKEATCVESGYTGDVYCKDCGEMLSEGEAILAAGEHTWNEGEIEKEATCTESGSILYACIHCSSTKRLEMEPTNHADTEVRDQEDATCISTGYTGDVYCKNCGELIEEGEVILATGEHTWDEGEIEKEATCTESGSILYACIHCSSTKRSDMEPTNHADKEIRNRKTATCKDAGYTGDVYCKTCGELLEKGVEIPALEAHIWNGGTVTKNPSATEKGIRTYICSVCGTVRTEDIPAIAASAADSFSAGGLTYHVLSNQTVEVTGMAKKGKTVRIPPTVTKNGITYKVVSIKQSAFKGNKKITKAIIGKNVETIGTRAFYGCRKLKTILIRSRKLRSAGAKAIKNIHKKATIQCPKKQYKKYQKIFNKKAGYQKSMKVRK